MGSFFDTLTLHCSKTRLKNALREYMAAAGYRTDNRTPELQFAILPGKNGWCALHGDALMDAFAENLPAALSAALGLPVLHIACFDSDFLYLTLHRGEISNAACVGTPYDGDPPLPDPAHWADFVPNFERFSEILRENHVFAEEALVPLGQLIGFDSDSLNFHFGDTLPDNAIACGFSRVAIKEKPLVSDGPTILGGPRGPHARPTPYSLDRINAIRLQNFGGPSRGIEVIVEAAFAHRSDLRFEIYDTLLRIFPIHQVYPHVRPAGEFECISRDGPRSTWRAAFPDFEIPEGVNLNYSHSSMRKQMDLDLQHSFIFNYRLNIPEHLRELNIKFVPIEYPDGAYLWRLQDCCYSPQALEIFEHDGPDAFHRYIQDNER